MLGGDRGAYAIFPKAWASPWEAKQSHDLAINHIITF